MPIEVDSVEICGQADAEKGDAAIVLLGLVDRDLLFCLYAAAYDKRGARGGGVFVEADSV